MRLDGMARGDASGRMSSLSHTDALFAPPAGGVIHPSRRVTYQQPTHAARAAPAICEILFPTLLGAVIGLQRVMRQETAQPLVPCVLHH